MLSEMLDFSTPSIHFSNSVVTNVLIQSHVTFDGTKSEK